MSRTSRRNAERIADDFQDRVGAWSRDETLRAISSGAIAQQVVGPDGEVYDVVIQTYPEGEPEGRVLVIIAVNKSGGWSAFAPTTRYYEKEFGERSP